MSAAWWKSPSVHVFRLGRLLAWAGLVAVTGLLVHAEPRGAELPPGVRAHTGLCYRRDGSRRVKLDLYEPGGAAPAAGRPAIVCIHGGGWRGGSRRDFGPIVAPLARGGCVVAVVDYQLSRPGSPSWPGNLEDVRAAVVWLRAHATQHGIDPTRIAALGASAGGHLAALLGTRPEAAPGRAADDPPSRVQAVVALYAPLDLFTMSVASRQPGGPIDLLLGGLPEQAPGRARDASPALRVSAGGPPMFFIHGQLDQLVPPEQATRMAETLRRAGVFQRCTLLPSEGHGFGLAAGGHDLAKEILAFLDEAWNHDSQSRRP